MQGIMKKTAIAGLCLHQTYHTAKAIDAAKKDLRRIENTGSQLKTQTPPQHILGYHGGEFPIIPKGSKNFFITTLAPLALLYAQQAPNGAVGIVSVPKNTPLKTMTIPPSIPSETPSFQRPNFGDADYANYGGSSRCIPSEKVEKLPLQTVSVQTTPVSPQAIVYQLGIRVLATLV
jgi:hypothetical protein